MPFGPVTVAEVLPGVRLTLRVAVWPFGPVAVVLTWPPPRVVVALAVLPLGPVTVLVDVAWALAAMQPAATQSAVARIRLLIFM